MNKNYFVLFEKIDLKWKGGLGCWMYKLRGQARALQSAALEGRISSSRHPPLPDQNKQQAKQSRAKLHSTCKYFCTIQDIHIFHIRELCLSMYKRTGSIFSVIIEMVNKTKQNKKCVLTGGELCWSFSQLMYCAFLFIF